MCGRGTSTQQEKLHCVKSVHIWNFSGPYFSQSKCEKIQTRKITNTYTFHVLLFNKIRRFGNDKKNIRVIQQNISTERGNTMT